MKEIYNLPLEIQMKIMTFTAHPLAEIIEEACSDVQLLWRDCDFDSDKKSKTFSNNYFMIFRINKYDMLY